MRRPTRRSMAATAALLTAMVASQTPVGADSWVVMGPPLPITRLVDSSPADNEIGVALARETVLRFSAPLDPSTVNAASISATFGGGSLPARFQISADNRTVTLFYLRHLPDAAQVEVRLDGDVLRDHHQLRVDADGDGTEGGVALLNFQTLPLTSIADTTVVGRVFASEPVLPAGHRKELVNRPLAGVHIFVEGAEDRLTTVTDSLGNFRLENVPGGDFFVYIDGRTVTTTADGTPTRLPQGPYYPFVGKKWTSSPGTETAVPDIFLPLVTAGTLQIVSNTQTTTVQMPASVVAENPDFAGVELLVPPGALYADDGQRGGRVGLAPVAPDRIPSPLPEGLEFPLVITVQTDGPANFDQPIPVCFPNIDNPNTPENEKLEPGAKSALWSFDHDIGEWDIVGPMTVSEDGKLICSDPGVGIREPGWHGSIPSGKNDKKKPPAKQKPKPDDPPPPCTDPGKEPPDKLTDEAEATVSDGIDCLRGTNKAQDTVQCRAQNNASLRSSSRYAEETMVPSLVNDPNSRRSDYRAACNAMQDRLSSHFRDTNSCGNYQEALQKLRDAADCLDAVGAAGAQVCDKARNAAGNCKPPAATNQACDALENAKNRGDALRNQANRSEDANERTVAERERLQGIIDSLCPLVRKAFDPAAADEILTPAERAFIAGKVAEYVAQVEVVDALYMDEAAVTDVFDQTWRDMAAAREAINEALLTYWAESDDEPRFFLLEVNGQQRRFKFPGASPAEFLRGDVQAMISWYDPRTSEVGFTVGVTAAIGAQDFLEPGTPQVDESPDTDGDGLKDFAELVVGTNANNRDTDSDGITDGEEVRQGTDPADGLALRTGIIASVDTPGFANDVAALDNLVAVADGEAGVTLFNVFSGFTPVRVDQYDTPGTASHVALGSGLLAVADGAAGVQFINVEDPPSSFLVANTSATELGGVPVSVALAGTTAIVSTGATLLAVEARSGAVLARRGFEGGLVDAVLCQDSVATLTGWGSAEFFAPFNGRWTSLGSASLSAHPVSRLFGGGTMLYASSYNGYSTVDLTNPAAPVVLGTPNYPANGVRSVTPNGSGLALGPVAIQNFYQPADVDLFDARNPAVTTNFLTTFETPGDARAIAIYNGLAYVADGEAGLQVINYLAQDMGTVAPTISLTASFPLGASPTLEEGKAARLTAVVADDVQVRQVEFYLDDNRVLIDGGFPFEYRFTAPLRSAKPSLQLKARVFDTGGNFTWSDELTVTLAEDLTAPEVVAFAPPNNSLNGSLASLSVFFSEPMNPATLTAASVQLSSAGADRRIGTADDVAVALPATSLTNSDQTLVLTLATPLPAGLHRLTVQRPAADRKGNLLAATASTSFATVDLAADRDHDCVADAIEELLGLNPDVADSDGNGTPDGDSDSDGDTITNCEEVALGTDPSQFDSDGDGISDADEDNDRDGLSNILEVRGATRFDDPDTDHDGFDDGEEVAEGSNPNAAASKPTIAQVGPSVAQSGAIAIYTMPITATTPAGENAAQSLPVLVHQNMATTADFGAAQSLPVSVRNDAP